MNNIVREESGAPLGGRLSDDAIIVYAFEWATSLAANLLACNRLGEPTKDATIIGACRGEVVQYFRKLADNEVQNPFLGV